MSEFDEKYKDITIHGSHFPDKPIKNDVVFHFTREIKEEYIPVLNEVMKDYPYGFRLLMTVMTFQEGFYKGSRSYSTKNPGNIGNTDSGANKFNGTLRSGIELQRDYILNIVNGKSKAYPMGKKVILKPYFSKEIAKHAKTYQMSPYVPGYEFTFTGQLDQFVKIYSTGARAGNSYLNKILSAFKYKGIELTPESKIQDIIKIEV